MFRMVCVLLTLIAVVVGTECVVIGDDSRTIKRNTAGEQRIALVIGNGRYKTKPLKNPENDAGDIAATLERLGFAVQLELNADKRGMEDAIRTFGKKLQGGGVGLFYFAGHGLQVEGNNYLVPTGGVIESEADVPYEAVRADRVLEQMKRAGNRLNMVFLDACRDNPFESGFRSSAGKGLVQMKAAKGSLIAYATAPGSVAADGGKGRNGLYTRYLLEYLSQSGLTVEEMLKKVRLAVSRETGDKQIPWESSSLIGDFYFNSGDKVSQNNDTVPVPSKEKKPAYSVNADEELWRAVNESGKLSDYEYFLKEYPNSPFVRTAKFKARKLREEVEKSSLTVKLEPAEALVRILNIKDRYQPGMRLQPGRYEVEVSAEGYATKTDWVELPASDDVSVEIALKSLGPKQGDTYTDPTTGMEFVYVEGGCYQMGDTFGDGDDDEKPVHEVCVDDFYMGRYEVTQGEYRKIIGDNPSYFKKGDNYPVEKVSWDDARNFISKLNGKSSRTYRLPTEAEWEYAARSGGKNEKYSGGNDVGSVAWYNSNSDSTTHSVGRKSANGLGLYDMSGNVWEWCGDWYGENYYGTGLRDNPAGPLSGGLRVYRGGSWNYLPRYVRSGVRSRNSPLIHYSNLGFRLVLQADSVR